MSTARPANGRQNRSGGGRALMLLGVLLAVLSGVLVIYIVSQATNNGGQTEQLVIATKNIPAQTTIDSTALIQADFTVKTFPLSLVPNNAYVFVSQDALNTLLYKTVTATEIYEGEPVFNSDPRFIPEGAIASGSLIGSNPNKLKPGEELFPLQYSDPTNGVRGMLVAGDAVDVIVTECGTPWNASGACVTQTTFQSVPVYAIFNGYIIVVMKQQDAQTLKLLAQTGNVTLAIRLPNDPNGTTTAVTPATVAHEFSFNG